MAISHLELAEEHTELGVYAKAVIPQGQMVGALYYSLVLKA